MRRESLHANLHPDISLRLLHALLVEEGLDPDSALRAAGVRGGIDQLPSQISGHQELNFQKAFVRITGYRPDLWLRAGLRYRIAAFGWLGLAIITARDLQQIIEDPLKVYYSYTSAFTRPIHVDGQIVGQELDVSDVPDDLREFAVCQSAGAIIALYSDLLAGSFPFTLVRLSIPKPTVDVSALIPCPVSYDSERTAWYWPPEASRRPFPHADPILHEIITSQLQRELFDKIRFDDLLARVKACIDGAGNAAHSVADIAGAVGVTRRTLQRRLTERGMSFRSLVDQVRRERAIGMLLSTELPVSDIAFRVGFSEITGFEHAFKRWTGETPKQFRSKFVGNPSLT